MVTSMNREYAWVQCQDCKRLAAVGSDGLCDMCRSAVPLEPIGRKDDLGKLRFDLVPARSLEDLVRIYTYGAQKYADRNWEKGIEWSRVFAAMMRHLWAFWSGETLDPESGMPHMAHAAWGCFTLLEYARTHNELDNRPVKD